MFQYDSSLKRMLLGNPANAGCMVSRKRGSFRLNLLHRDSLLPFHEHPMQSANLRARSMGRMMQDS